MTKNKLVRCVLLIFFFIFIGSEMTQKEVCAADSEVIFTVKESKAGNLYYQITRDREKITEDATYTIKEENGNIVYKGKTEEAILFLEQIPFGRYILIIHEKRDYAFEIHICKEYVKTQHILKIIELKERKAVKTGDMAGNTLIRNLAMEISMIFIFLLVSEKRRKRYE